MRAILKVKQCVSVQDQPTPKHILHCSLALLLGSILLHVKYVGYSVKAQAGQSIFQGRHFELSEVYNSH